MLRGEKQYLKLVKKIIDYGYSEKGRNGNTLCLLGENMRFSLKNNTIPLLTTKKMAWKSCLKELLWFISGDTSMKLCKNKMLKYGMVMQVENF